MLWLIPRVAFGELVYWLKFMSMLWKDQLIYHSMHCARCYHRLLFFISLGSIIKLEFPLLDMLSDWEWKYTFLLVLWLITFCLSSFLAGEKQTIEWLLRLRVTFYIAEVLGYSNTKGLPPYHDLNAYKVLFDEVSASRIWNKLTEHLILFFYFLITIHSHLEWVFSCTL